MKHFPAAAARLADADPILRARWYGIATAARAGPEALRRKLPDLLTTSTKVEKGEKYGILTGILYLAPSTEAGLNVCPWASEGCAAACLGHSSGRMAMTMAKRARILRTWAYFLFRREFFAVLRAELSALSRRARRKGMRPYARLNGTSDLDFTFLMGDFPQIQFYDYTKSLSRALADLPPNYHVTFSRSESNESACKAVLASGGNVAAVFIGDLPATYLGAPVVDGDASDGRPDDAHGVIVGLSTKGPKARADKSGFAIRGHA